MEYCRYFYLPNIYINDITKIFKYVKTSLYADDAKLYAPIIDQSCVRKVQEDLDSLSRWCKTWRLRLNAQKCFLLHYVPQGCVVEYPQYKIDDFVLQRRDNASDLGVIITDKLKFHNQVMQACKKASWEINRIRRTFVSRNPEFLSCLFKMYVRPHVEYLRSGVESSLQR